MSGISDRNPYVGPRSIQRGEPLYGRSEEIEELFNRLQARRIVVLHSPSGAGKSSLVQAGLIPRLEAAKFDVWKPIRVNLDPSGLEGVPEGVNRYLLSAMSSLEAELPEEHRRSPAELARLDFRTYIDERPRRKRLQHRPSVLLFDQFEEILTVAPSALESKHAFFREVGKALREEQGRGPEAEAASEDERVYWALFIIREDFLAAFAPYRDHLPTQMANLFRLDFLDGEGALEAVRLPAEKAGREFPEDVARQLVQDLSTQQIQQPDGSFRAEQGHYVEPVQMQVVCRRLWDKMPEDDLVVDPEDIEDYASVSESLGAYYDEAVAKAAKGEFLIERELREWIGRALIVGGIRSQVRQGASQSGGLDNAHIVPLLDAYLVRTEHRGSANWYELSHDRLIEPVQASNEAWEDDNLHPLQVQARMWVESDRAMARLLSEEALRDARGWIEANGSILTEDEKTYVETSRERVAAARTRRLVRGGTVGTILAMTIVFSAVTFNSKLQIQGQMEQIEQQMLKIEEQKDKIAREQEEQKRSLSAQRGLRAMMLIKANREAEALGLAVEAVGVYGPDWDENPAPAKAIEGLEQVLANDALLVTDSRVLDGHEGAITALGYSPSGDKLVTVGVDKLVKMWDPATGTLLATLEGHTGTIRGLAYADTPQGVRLATGDDAGGVRVWDGEGALVHSFEGNGGRLSLAFSPDGTRLAGGGKDKLARVWSVESGELLATMKGHIERVTGVAFSHDGRLLSTSEIKDRAWLWDANTGARISELTGHSGMIYVAPFSPDDALLATASGDATARLWKVEGVEGGGPVEVEVHAYLNGHTDRIYDLAWSPSGEHVATASKDRTMRIWDRKGKMVAQLWGHEDYLYDIIYSPDGARLATAGRDATARIWDSRSGQPIATLLGHKEMVLAVRFSPDGAQLATASADGTAQLWDANIQSPVATEHGHAERIEALAYSPTGAWLATASADYDVKIWHSTEVKLASTLSGHGNVVNALAWSPDGSRLASGSWDNTAKIWDPRTGELVHSLDDHSETVYELAFSPDGSRLATASQDKSLGIWNPETGERLLELEGHTGWIMTMAWSPDGTRIASAGHDHTAMLWDAASGTALATLSGHEDALGVLEYASDGARLATGGRDGARLWDADSGELVAALVGHEGEVFALAFAPDGAGLATVAADGKLGLWDASGGERVALSGSGHEGYAKGVAYAPGGERIATVGQDGSVMLWSASTGELLETRTGEDASELSLVAWSPHGERFVSAGMATRVTLWDPLLETPVAAFADHVGLRQPDGSVEWPTPPDRLVRIGCERLAGEVYAKDAGAARELCLSSK